MSEAVAQARKAAILRIGEIDSKVRSLLSQRQELMGLVESMQTQCIHSFLPPAPGNEHEGGHCKWCGVNELYGHTLSLQRKNQ